jgi:hypothetical protein
MDGGIEYAYVVTKLPGQSPQTSLSFTNKKLVFFGYAGRKKTNIILTFCDPINLSNGRIYLGMSPDGMYDMIPWLQNNVPGKTGTNYWQKQGYAVSGDYSKLWCAGNYVTGPNRLISYDIINDVTSSFNDQSDLEWEALNTVNGTSGYVYTLANIHSENIMEYFVNADSGSKTHITRLYNTYTKVFEEGD